MTQTPNYDLNLFDSTDDMEENSRLGLNDNADKIDTALKDIQDEVDGLSSPAASSVTYDNTVSGLTATDVQAALDEELDKIDILSNSVSALADYSTTEQVIGKWTDGKPIYRKTIDIGQLPVATTKNVAHGVANIGKIMSATGFSFDNGGSCLALPLVSGTPEYSIAVWCDSTNVKVSTYIDRSTYSGYINLEYTKTTD